jgi:hypothetical protein
VFNNGTSIGLKTSIPFGGQIEPMSTTGDKADAKKSSKKSKKKHNFRNNKKYHTITQS